MNYGNTVGSQQRKIVTWSKDIRELQKRLVLTNFQRKVLIGTLLGDGGLIVNAYGKNYRLHLQHSAKQREYLEWKYQIFEEWCISKPKFQKVTNSWKFRTISHPIFTELHKLFYKDDGKILPTTISNLLNNPCSLAVWFMDDGGKMVDRYGERAVLFNVQQLSLTEVKRLQQVLVENFSLPTTSHKNNSGYRLYLGRKHCKQFNSLVSKYMHPVIRYKLLSV